MFILFNTLIFIHHINKTIEKWNFYGFISNYIKSSNPLTVVCSSSLIGITIHFWPSII